MDVKQGAEMSRVEIRTSRTAAALLLFVLICLMAPIGIVVSEVVAQATGGRQPPRLLVAPDPVSDAVAATPADFRVDESGAAIYSVPIFVVPGTAGVLPQLSLNYSSQGGYGPLGRGWSIGGLSAIGRCRATREAGDFLAGAATPDGDPNPINFSTSDRFCLDGQRLIDSPTSSCPAVSGMVVQELRTELESFRRVCRYQAAGGSNGPAFFTVESKDGSIAWYGDRDQNASSNRPDGYFESTAPGQTAKALSWAQTRFQDSTGNYIDYLYLENQGGAVGEHLIGEVRFTGKVALPGQAAPASAPYARVVFNYGTRPSAQWAKGYVSGGQVTQSRRLESITSCATIDCTVYQQVRHYLLTYQTSTSGSGLDVLVGLQECRDVRVEACASPTAFQWTSAVHGFSTAEHPNDSAFGGANTFDGFKLGDIDGDGRLDVVWLKDAGCSTEQVMVSFSSLDAAGNQAFTPGGGSPVCTPTELISPIDHTNDGRTLGDSSWQLFDYNGDGLDDLFVAGGGAGDTWAIYPSRGRASSGQIFDTSINLIAGIPIPVDRVGYIIRKAHPQLADINGDGLLDVVYKRGGPHYVRLMERVEGAYRWGAERAVVFPAYPVGNPCENAPGSNCSSGKFIELSQNIGTFQLLDFNGDARSDLSAQVVMTWSYSTEEPCETNMRRSADPAIEEDAVPTADFGCTYHLQAGYVAAMTVSSITATQVIYDSYGSWWSRPASLIFQNLAVDEHFADFNGDGTTDLLKEIVGPSQSQYTTWQLYLNTGKGFPEYPIYIPQIPNQNGVESQARVTDVNGDGRADLLYWVDQGPRKVYVARYGLPNGGLSAQTALPGNNAAVCEGSGCNALLKVPVFADLDGDGGLDFLSFKTQSNIDLYVSRAGQRFTARDVIARITNGLGAKTELTYAPLTNAAVYRRANTSRNAPALGRGSPVTDLLAPMYVVARVASSSPQAGNPNALATVHYRYANGRVQGGGRGFLGFGTIETIDPNQNGGHVVTGTIYRQDYPFAGMPLRTVKKVVGGAYTVPACLTGPVNNTCFGAPGQAHVDLGGSWLSDSEQAWEVAPASLASQVPLHVRTAGSDERLRDPFTGTQTGRVVTAFVYGTNGNVTQTAFDTYTGSASTPTATVITQNTYADDTARWRLGRLTASTVTHRRPGQPDVVRTTGFSYQMGGTATGLLTEERMQPGGAANLASTKTYQLDDYGNRLQTTTCAGPATPCSTSGFQFHPATATQVKRYARVTYDEQGRFPTGTWEPFWSETGGEERQTSRVTDRNVFGDPISAYDVNNVHSYAVAGLLGRPYYAWRQTVQFGSPGSSGVRTLTTYRKCDQVECPAGAAFRQQVETTALPRQWTYFDVLGRPVMQAAETFNAGVANEDVAATCSDYTAAGQPWRVSNPFFLSGTVSLAGPTGIANVCGATTRKWTTTTYDALGRPTQVVGPDSSQATVSYAGLTTTRTDPRANPTTEVRNGLGETVSVTDAAGLTIGYAFDAAGNVVSVSRNAGSGTIANTFQYDVLGRKVQQSDPDIGSTVLEYNALDELTAQVDSAGNRIEHAIDARGRVWRTTVKDSTGLTETESTFTYDSNSGADPRAPGQLMNEVITGTYAGWAGQLGTALDYRRDHYYDPMGRALGSVVQVDGQVFGNAVAYDALGRPWQAMDATGHGVKTEYGPRGHARALCATPGFGEDPACAAADTYQRTLQVDAWGNVARERRGDSAALEVARTVWADTGRIASICAGNTGCSLVNEQYGWDAAGNLTSHLKEQRYLETFTYDALNRLMTGTLLMRDGVTVNQGTLAMGYDALGNVCGRNGTGYGYGGAAGCAGTTGMAALPALAPAVARGIVIPNTERDLREPPPETTPARRAGMVPLAALAALGNLRAWETQVGWRSRFVHHAANRTRSDDDRPSWDDESRDWGLAHGIVSDGGASFWTARTRRSASEARPATAAAARASLSALPAAGVFSTGPGGPHAVSQTVTGGSATGYTYDSKGNQVFRDAPGTANDRAIAYTLDDKAHEIQMGSGQRVRFWYGPDGQRYKREEAGKVTYYVGGVEVVVQGGVTTMKRYVGGIALQTVVGGVVQGTKYLFHDQLGSLVRIANADGSVAERLDYLAFGGRRNPADPHAAGTASAITPKGYTGHEYVDGTGVIHMNGRIYDSELGRFLQADPIIQAPANAQSWNAYSYVFNNPLKYTDPTGQFAWMAALMQTMSTVTAVIGPTLTAGQIVGAVAVVGATAFIATQGLGGMQGLGGAYAGGTSASTSNGSQGSNSSGAAGSSAGPVLPPDGVQIVGPVYELGNGGYAFTYLNIQGEIVLSIDIVAGASPIPAAITATEGIATAGVVGGTLDSVQTALDVAGFLPVVGTAADLVNAGIHLYRGNYAMAAAGVVFAVPVLGDAAAAGFKGAKLAKAVKKTPAAKADSGYGVNDSAARLQGPWTEPDYLTALQGKPPASFGRPDLHHADQMPGSAIHEISPIQHRGNSALHPNKYNQGVTAEMRMQDRQLHWWYRAREQGADQLFPDLIYD